jgi:tetratricopeptide (TPR) repeat protein
MMWWDVIMGHVTLPQYFRHRNLARQIARETWKHHATNAPHGHVHRAQADVHVQIDLDLSAVINELRQQTQLQHEVLDVVNDIKILMGDLVWSSKKQLWLLSHPRQAQAEERREWADRDYDLEQYDQALAHYQESNRLYPQDAYVLRSMATIYFFHKHDAEGARPCFDGASIYAQTQGLRGDARFWVGMCFAVGRRWQEALDQMAQAVALNPNHWDAHYYQAGLAALTGNQELALASLRTAIQGDPGNFERSKRDLCFRNSV